MEVTCVFVDEFQVPHCRGLIMEAADTVQVTQAHSGEMHSAKCIKIRAYSVELCMGLEGDGKVKGKWMGRDLDM